ncbi:MAG TPA: GNAT family N-acetyltransferase [Chitinophagaceae bacterium]|nr:GNAT family N-acetyltransferase [Chitinophagaceae bacterium]
MPEFVIRYASADEAELIADLSRKTFYETFGYVNTKENMDKFLNEQFTREKLISEVTEPGNTFLLALDGDTPVGYVRMREGKMFPEFENKDSIEIARIYVVNSYIGTGVGQQMMRQCIFIAKELKKEIIWLGVWEKNRRAIAFYTKWGFEKFNDQNFLLGDDLQNDWLLMKKI